jgi:uncharacterized protein DUF3386
MTLVDVAPVSVVRDGPRAKTPGPVPVVESRTAASLLQRAQGAFQKWPEGFTGFSADIRCRALERDVEGRVRVVTARPKATPRGVLVEASLPDPELAARVERMLAGVTRDRVPRFFKDADGRFPLTLERLPDDCPGYRIVVHRDDASCLTYRLDSAGRLRACERRAGSMRIVTTFEEFVRATPGRFLPTRTVTSCFDAVTGRLVRTATVVDVHRRIDHVWLPAGRECTVTEAGACRTTTLELDGHVLL